MIAMLSVMKMRSWELHRSKGTRFVFRIVPLGDPVGGVDGTEASILAAHTRCALQERLPSRRSLRVVPSIRRPSDVHDAPRCQLLQRALQVLHLSESANQRKAVTCSCSMIG